MSLNNSLGLLCGALIIFLAGILSGKHLAPSHTHFTPYPDRKPYIIQYVPDCYIEYDSKEVEVKPLKVEDLY